MDKTTQEELQELFECVSRMDIILRDDFRTATYDLKDDYRTEHRSAGEFVIAITEMNGRLEYLRSEVLGFYQDIVYLEKDKEVFLKRVKELKNYLEVLENFCDDFELQFSKYDYREIILEMYGILGYKLIY